MIAMGRTSMDLMDSPRRRASTPAVMWRLTRRMRRYWRPLCLKSLGLGQYWQISLFKESERRMQRYKNELEKETKDKLHTLISYQKHHLVTPEIRRELNKSRNRGEEDDVMSISSPISVINKPIEDDRWDFPEVLMEED